MRPKLALQGLEETKPSEYVIRFVLGGLITACAGLISKSWGPVVGGLFLGFPAILPASLTLVQDHEGRKAAVDDARGGRLGSVGMVAFAAVVWATARAWSPVLVLVTATLVWLAVDVALWGIRHGRERA
jgi:hypothetical protein